MSQTLPKVSTATARAIASIRGTAPEQSPTVRALATFSAHTDCHLATLGFAARVDFERLLRGTPFQAPYGQSPFAHVRGMAFEERLRKHGYALTLQLLRERMGFAVGHSSVINLREGYP